MYDVYPRGYNHWGSQDIQRGGGGQSERAKRPSGQRVCVCVCVCVWGGGSPINLFNSPINEGGGVAYCALLSYAKDSGVARIFQRGSKRGSKETEQGEGVDGRDFFFFVYQNCIFCIIIGFGYV